MMRMSRSEFRAIERKMKDRARRRQSNAKFQQKVRSLTSLTASLAPTVKCLDTLWALAVKLRDRQISTICRVCGRRPGTVSYHIVTKQRGHAIRWDLSNGVLACAPCNLGEMLNRAAYRDKHMALFGRDRIERIEAIARAGLRIDRFAIERNLRDVIAKHQGGK